MPDLTLWGLFVMASVVLLLTPGPAVLYIVARLVERARVAATTRASAKPAIVQACITAPPAIGRAGRIS
jgi:threonine/homoserine/homoserine lactone efflux protein